MTYEPFEDAEVPISRSISPPLAEVRILTIRLRPRGILQMSSAASRVLGQFVLRLATECG